MALMLCLATVGLGTTAGGATAAPGHVYVSTNAEAGNAVVVYKRANNGLLKVVGSYDTGAKGGHGNLQFPGPLPLADSDTPLVLSPNGKLLFVTNVGSNSVTSFRVKGDRLVRVQTVPSGGQQPTAVDAQAGLLYVSNAGSATLTGYRYASNGRLTAISGSAINLSSPTALPASVKIDPQGQYLISTSRVGNCTQPCDGPGEIRRYPLSGGVPGTPVVYPPTYYRPYAAEILKNDTFLVADEGKFPTKTDDSIISTFNGTGSSTSPISTTPTGVTTTCWFQLTKDGRYGFASAAVGGAVTRFSLGSDGKVTVLGTEQIPGVASDPGISRDGKYLYVLSTDIDFMTLTFKSAYVTIYRIGSAGQLTKIGQSSAMLDGAASGLAAR